MQPKVGQIVYLTPGINNSRRSGNAIVEGVLKTIGRKYYTVVVGYYEYRFDRKDLRQDTKYAPDYYLYFDKQEILDQREIAAIRKELRNAIEPSLGKRVLHLTLDQLRRMKAIINEQEATQ